MQQSLLHALCADRRSIQVTSAGLSGAAEAGWGAGLGAAANKHAKTGAHRTMHRRGFLRAAAAGGLAAATGLAAPRLGLSAEYLGQLEQSGGIYRWDSPVNGLPENHVRYL